LLTIYPVQARVELPWNHPLHVGKFFNLEGKRWKARKQRQALILSTARAWKQLTARNPGAPGLVREEIFLTHLAKQAPDAKEIFRVFFKIERTGYRFSDGLTAPTTISPRKLPAQLAAAVEQLDSTVELTFDPGQGPTAEGFTRSPVTVRRHKGKEILRALEGYGRADLIPPVKWLLERPQPITFYHRPSGKLQARDTSVWPVRAIETWPGWLRAELFGTCIDIDNAFSQFLMEHLSKKHAGKEAQLRLKYPDIVAIAEDKRAFRAALIEQVLKTKVEPTSLKLIKRLLMAIANGSNASPQLFTGSSSRCEAANIIRLNAPWLSTTDLLAAGERLQRVAHQFRQAKKELCIYLFSARPTAKNQKRIFTLYFNWEREARYKLWGAVGQTGLQMHDGLDGIINNEPAEELRKRILAECNLKITVKEVNDASIETQRVSLAQT